MSAPQMTGCELTNGRWLGERGIFRHRVPDVEDISPEVGEVIWHTIVTSVANWAGIEGELCRWVADDGQSGYEVRVNGTDEHHGICDVAAYSIGALAGLAKVANDLRYEWEIITGVYANEGIVWSA